MSFIPINLPPGVMRSGTERQSAGRWYETHLVRWYEGSALGPVLGWSARSTSAITGKGRALATWTDDSGTRWAAIGTESHLYAMNQAGALFDITPSGFTAGRASAAGNTGYGSGNYGAGLFGTPRPDRGNYLPATVWDLDTFGQYLDGCTADDGTLYEWQLNTGAPAAAITNAPTACQGLVVTPQRFLVALGAGGNRRKIQWCDQEDNTTWTPTTTNQAGDIDVSMGVLICGKPVGDDTLILTDVDAHLFSYIGLPFVYSRRKIGDGCGAVSKRCIVVAGLIAAWWSTSGFWMYDGFVKPLPCELWDYLNRTVSVAQRSKISGWHNAKYQEMEWVWPSSVECDNYVSWNYKYNIWTIGQKSRLSGVSAGAFVNPLMVGTDGIVYDHESGYSYSGQSDPYARSGPVELGKGDNTYEVLQIVPDDKTAGDVSVSFRTRFYPDSDETTFGPYTIDSTGKTDARFTARQVAMVVTGVASTNWRWGNSRWDVIKGSEI